VWNIWSQGAEEILRFICEKEENGQKFISLNGKEGIEKARRKCRREGGIIPKISSLSDLQQLSELSSNGNSFWVQVYTKYLATVLI
jgi:hypothetical protein